MEVAKQNHYNNPEFVKVAEEIYECQGKKQELELNLSSERFHYGYIAKRKDLVVHEVFFRLLFIVPLTLLLIGAVFLMLFFIIDIESKEDDSGMTENIVYDSIEDPFSGFGSGDAGSDGWMQVVFLFCTLFVVFGGYADIKLLKREIKMLVLLSVSRNNERALRFAKKHEINTFQSDEYQSREKISWLENEIALTDSRISVLQKKQQELLDEQAEMERKLQEEETLRNEGSDSFAVEGGFTLKKSGTGTQNADMLYEFYKNEEHYIQNDLLRLEGQLHHTEKEIVEINENFMEIKRKIIISLVVFVFLILIQSAFTGIAENVTSVICLIAGLVYVFYVEKKWTQPILLYFIENDSDLTKEYAFVNNIRPVKLKREELLNEINNYKKKLIDIKKKRESIIFS